MVFVTSDMGTCLETHAYSILRRLSVTTLDPMGACQNAQLVIARKTEHQLNLHNLNTSKDLGYLGSCRSFTLEIHIPGCLA